MASEKTVAIMLRVVDFSESSCIVTCYTRDFGKIGALAKGARRPKGPFEGALDLLSLSRIVFLHKSSGALDLLTEAKLERRFRSSQRDLKRLYSGYYVAELLNALTLDHDPNPEIFDLANSSLAQIDGEGELEPELVRFELKLLEYCGQFPSLSTCVICGRPVQATKRIAFALIAGGVTCDRCCAGQRKVIRVSQSVVAAMQEMSEQDEHEWRSNGLPAASRGELRAVINQYLAHLLGRVPRMRAYLRGLVH